jgi:hypothetical protein
MNNSFEETLAASIENINIMSEWGIIENVPEEALSALRTMEIAFRLRVEYNEQVEQALTDSGWSDEKASNLSENLTMWFVACLLSAYNIGASGRNDNQPSVFVDFIETIDPNESVLSKYEETQLDNEDRDEDGEPGAS